MVETIGLIGSGMIAGQVARLAIAAGYYVILSNSRGPETLQDLVTELGDSARAATPDQVARDADLIVASIPFKAYKQLPVDALAGKIVIDTMNYYPERDGEMAEIATDRIATSELVQRHLAGAQVVRGINNMDWVRLRGRARLAGAADRSAMPIAGDDAQAKAAVTAFLDNIGYDAVDMGPLAESWRSEPTTPVYVAPYMGDVPSSVSADEARSWFMDAPGVPVPADAVRSLLDRAVRHDKMFGDLGPLPGSSF